MQVKETEHIKATGINNLQGEKGNSVLVVEDDVIIQKLISRKMRKRQDPFQIKFAGTVREALDLLQTQTFLAIVSDYYLPDGTAKDLLNHKADKPFILMTGSHDLQLAVEFMKQGADDFITKDLNSEFVEVIPVSLAKLIKQYQQARQLELEKQRFKDLFDNSNDLIQFLDGDGNYLYVNPAWRETLGYSEGELQDINYLKVIHAKDREHCGVMFRDMKPGENLDNIEVCFQGKTGTCIDVIGSVSCVLDEEGKISTRGIFKNISALRKSEEKLKESESNYRNLVENVGEIICRTNYEGKITFVNDEVLNMLGYTREEVEGRYFMEFTADEHKERANRFYIEQYKKKIRDTYVEFKLKKKDGQKIWVGQGARIEYNERGLLKNFLLVIRDISERKKAEKKIQQQKKQLEKKNTELEESYKRLLRAKASKKTAGIILVIALFLFVFSEVMIEPLIENYFSDSWEYTGIIVKGILALSLKPLDNSLENYFLKNG